MDDLEEQGVPVPTRWQTSLQDCDQRPSIKKYENSHKFRVNDQVRIKATGGQGLRGPYTVSKACEKNKYLLEQSDGTKIDNGKEFSENELEHAT